MIKDGLIVITTIMITLLIYNLNRRHQMMLENERLQSENLLVHYETLESQLDPHFLFNSLNTLSGLIGMDDDKAQEYLQQLASTYRYTIQQNKLVPIVLPRADSTTTILRVRKDSQGSRRPGAVPRAGGRWIRSCCRTPSRAPAAPRKY